MRISAGGGCAAGFQRGERRCGHRRFARSARLGTGLPCGPATVRLHSGLTVRRSRPPRGSRRSSSSASMWAMPLASGTMRAPDAVAGLEVAMIESSAGAVMATITRSNGSQPSDPSRLSHRRSFQRPERGSAGTPLLTSAPARAIGVMWVILRRAAGTVPSRRSVQRRLRTWPDGSAHRGGQQASAD